MLTQLRVSDPSSILGMGNSNNVTPTVNMLFMNAGAGGVMQALGVDTSTTTQAGRPTVGGLVIAATVDDNVNTTLARSTVGQGLYAPRLRFVRGKEEAEALEKPEVISQMEAADLKRAAQLIGDLIDKYDLPEAANISLVFRDQTAVIQGRVPNPTVRKQVEMYLEFEPGIYSVENHLVIDSTLEPPTTNSAL